MNQQPCLSYRPNDNEDRTFVVRIEFSGDPIDWDVLRPNVAVQRLIVLSLGRSGRHGQVDQNIHSLHLALYIHLHPELSQLRFANCTIDDVGPICVAMAAKQHLTTRLEFCNCSLTLRAAQALQLMLEANKIAVLLFNCCECSIEFNETIAMRLRDNQSLQVLQFRHHKPTISSPLITALGTPNLVEIRLTMNDSKGWWNLLRAVEKKNKLQILKVATSTLDLRSMEALTLMCVSISSLRKLDFCNCKFTENSLEYLALALSRSNAIDTLIFGALVRQHSLPNGPLRRVPFENLQVDKLLLSPFAFEKDIFLHMLESLANNPFIKCLEVSGGGREEFKWSATHSYDKMSVPLNL